MYEDVIPEVQGPYSLGSKHWPGLGKLIEETSELQEVLAKIVANGGKVRTVTADVAGVGLQYPDSAVPVITHYDGRNLLTNLLDELADVQAAVKFFLIANPGSKINAYPEISAIAYVESRAVLKLKQYMDWHNRHMLAHISSDHTPMASEPCGD